MVNFYRKVNHNFSVELKLADEKYTNESHVILGVIDDVTLGFYFIN